MIQSSYKSIDHVKSKAPDRVKSTFQGNRPHDLESKLEKEEFESELKTASQSDKVEEKPVKVSADKALRKPSSLINHEESEGNPEAVSPKVFDPALTQDVQKLISPETVEVKKNIGLTDDLIKKIAEGENLLEIEAELKTEPQLNAEIDPELKAKLAEAELAELNVKLGEAKLYPEKHTNLAQAITKGEVPSALNLEKTESAPDLVNLEEFVAQKNLANKKAMPINAYGMQRPQAVKVALENGLKSAEVVKEAESVEVQGTNSQQFILNMMSEQKSGHSAPQEIQAPVKTFDMSQVKTTDSNKIMTQITDYIVQAKAANEPTVSMRVNHEQLGMIDITVAKSGQMNTDVAINIGAHSQDGKNFFQQNSKDLFSHLSSAGISVSDMKVETPSQSAKQDFNFSGGQKGQGQERQFGSEQNQRRHDSDRRQDLWKLLNKEAA